MSAGVRAALVGIALGTTVACAGTTSSSTGALLEQERARESRSEPEFVGPDRAPLVCDDALVPVSRPRVRPLRLEFADVALDCSEAERGSWALRTDDAWFHVALKGNPPPGSLALVRTDGGSGRALEFHLPASEPRPRVMEKVIVDVFGRFGGHESMLAFDEERYIAFRMMLPSSFEVPPDTSARMIVWQLWQGAPYGPPLRMEIDTDGRAVFFLLNDQTGSHPCASLPSCPDRSPEYEGVITLYRSAPLDRDVWHDFIVRVIPRHSGEGEVDIWLDQPRLASPSHSARLALGYDPSGYASYPSAESAELRHPNARLEVGFGIYRTPQRANQTVLFDRVSVGYTADDVAAPGPPGLR